MYMVAPIALCASIALTLLHISANTNISPVAVCFFGLTRSLRKVTYESIQRYLLAPLVHQGFHAHVFLHTYNQSFITNKRSRERHIALDTEEWQMLEPVRYKIEDPIVADQHYNVNYYAKFGNPWRDSGLGSLRNLLRQQHSIEQCFGLIQSFSTENKWPFKYIMFARPDLLYLPPGLPDIRSVVTGPNIIASRMYDRFAVGHPRAMAVWAYRMQSAQRYLELHNFGLHSERLLLFQLQVHNLTLVELKGFCFVRVRSTGAFMNGTRGIHDCSRPWGVRQLARDLILARRGVQ